LPLDGAREAVSESDARSPAERAQRRYVEPVSHRFMVAVRERAEVEDGPLIVRDLLCEHGQLADRRRQARADRELAGAGAEGSGVPQKDLIVSHDVGGVAEVPPLPAGRQRDPLPPADEVEKEHGDEARAIATGAEELPEDHVDAGHPVRMVREPVAELTL